MPRDFTIQTYQKLLTSFRLNGYNIMSFKEWMQKDLNKRQQAGRTPDHLKILIVRHDIDSRPGMAWDKAIYEHSLGISTTYYFKIDPQIFIPDLVKRISDLGHEIGYHYEDLVKSRGNGTRAIELFSNNLDRFRQIVPVVTVCAEGSPMSRYDNRDLWKEYDYRDFGIIGEPYLDIDYHDFLYLTDTGRIWNGIAYNVRDKVDSAFDYSYKSSFDIIRDLSAGRKEHTDSKMIITEQVESGYSKHKTQNTTFPNRVHMVTHPQRWSDDWLPWMKELTWQNIKNAGKRVLIMTRK